MRGGALDFFTASDGTRIAYRDEGEGVPLVLLHGLMAHGGFFHAPGGAGRRFPGDHRSTCAAMANRASTARARPSSSSPPTSPSSPRRSTFEGAIGVGWSMGATVLWHVLSGPAAARFAGAVVVDMTARVQERRGMGPRPLARGLRGAQQRDPRRFSPAFAATAGQGIFAQPVAATGRAWPTGRASNSPATIAGAIGSVWASLVRQDVRALLQKIEHPTLIVHGARSRLYGDDTADHLVAALPDARARSASTAPATPRTSKSRRCSTRFSEISRTACRAARADQATE